MEENDKIVTEENFEIEETDDTDWKAEAQKLQEKARGQRERTKTLKDDLKTLRAQVEALAKPPVSAPDSKDSFGLAEIAYLEAKGVDEKYHPIILEAMKATGKGLRETASSKYVLKEIEEAKEIDASKNAIADGTKRSNMPPRDELEYHYKKYEASGWKDLPEDRALKSKVVNERYRRESEVNKFPDNPITS